MKWLRLTLIIQIAFFIGWAVLEETKQYKSPVIVLKTVPVDPRDYLSGHYMILNYEIGQTLNLPDFSKLDLTGNTEIKVFLEPSDKIILNGKERDIYSAKSVEAIKSKIDNSKAENGLWVKGKYFRHDTIVYGIERYYFSEKRKDELNNIRSGAFFVEVYVSKSGQMKVKNLLFK